MIRNQAGQYSLLFAFDTNANAPATGEAANLTAYVSTGLAAFAAAGGSVTEVGLGYYRLSHPQAETDGSIVIASADCSTSGVEIMDAVNFTEHANTVMLYAHNYTTNTRATGDAANISVQISAGGAAFGAALGDLSEVGRGWYANTLLPAEYASYPVIASATSTTSGVELQDATRVATVGHSYPDASDVREGVAIGNGETGTARIPDYIRNATGDPGIIPAIIDRLVTDGNIAGRFGQFDFGDGALRPALTSRPTPIQGASGVVGYIRQGSAQRSGTRDRHGAVASVTITLWGDRGGSDQALRDLAYLCTTALDKEALVLASGYCFDGMWADDPQPLSDNDQFPGYIINARVEYIQSL